jgi:transcriptional regulator GlxA family with amidase domain
MRVLLSSTVALALAFGPGPFGSSFASPAVATSAAATDRLVLPAPKVGRSRPLVIVVADSAGAETTDFIIPYGVLKDSGVADVRTLLTRAGPVPLKMALNVLADSTIGQFDTAEPASADVVIVPAQMSPKDPVLSAWIRGQAAKGATIVSICEGARVLANAGLLDDKRVTTHWHALKSLEKSYPATTWVRDRSYIQDGPIISTAGVSASIPVSLALVEAIGGHGAASDTAKRLGVSEWSAAHRTADFELEKGDVSGAVGSVLAFWSHETVELPLMEGVDEVALALRADAWSRTFRSKVAATSIGTAVVRSRHGLIILPDSRPVAGRYVVPSQPAPAVPQLDASLVEMGRRYGQAAVRLAKLGMDMARRPCRASQTGKDPANGLFYRSLSGLRRRGGGQPRGPGQGAKLLFDRPDRGRFLL